MTGEVPVDMEGRGEFQDASQATLDDTAVMAPLTRLSKTVAGSQNLNHWFRHALTTMWAQPSGPVHLSLTHDALTGECDAPTARSCGFFDGRRAAEPRAGARRARLSGAAEGGDAGASPSWPAPASSTTRPRRASRRSAERWSIPVATTLRAKGVFPEDHDLSLGVFGYAGTRHATAAILRRSRLR